MMLKKLTEFIEECDNDESLTYFVKVIYHAQFAHSTIIKETNSKGVFIVYQDFSTALYAPHGLIEELLDHVDTSIIRTTVHYIKDNLDYKTKINYFQK